MTLTRSILHVDMDAFFASVEVLDDPALAGKPLLVGGDHPRAVVSTASYEARRFGCHSAQPMSVAKRLCPRAIIRPPRGARYREVSTAVFALFDRYTPWVEPLSIDEAFLDVTGSLRDYDSAVDLANRLRQQIREELRLTASVGIAPNMFLAKLASDMNKPDGVTVVEPGRVDEFLLPLKIEKIWGVGPATARRLHAIGVRTVADLRRLTAETLGARLGKSGEHFYRLARGIDARRVTPDARAKSISHEQTFLVDVAEAEEVRRVLLGEVEQVARRLRKSGLRTRSVAIKIRYGDFETISRSATLAEPSDSTARLWETARGLFDRWAGGSFRPVRLIGMGATRLSHADPQRRLFDDPQDQQQRRLDQVTDQILDRFGGTAIQRGATIRRRK